MTTIQLINFITIHFWSLSEKGAYITYTRRDKDNGAAINYLSPPIEVAQGLIAIASIDDYVFSPLVITVDGRNYTFQNFVKNYHLSQYDAFSLILRHELELQEGSSMTMLEIDEALRAILNN